MIKSFAAVPFAIVTVIPELTRTSPSITASSIERLAVIVAVCPV